MMQPLTRARRVRRSLKALLALVVVTAAVATSAYYLTRKPDPKRLVAGQVLKPVAITSGSLTTSEKIDGTLELSTSMNVLHRIEGETSNASTSTASALPTAPASSGSNRSGAGAGAATGSLTEGLVADCVVSSTTPAPTTTSTPDSAPLDSSGSAATATTSTPPATTAPSGDCPTPSSTPTSSTPTTTATGDTTPTSDTTTDDTTSDTSQTGARGSRSGAGGFSGSGSRSGSGGTASSGGSGSSSSTRVTQTVTSVIKVGATVGLGDVLYTVDSAPVVALSGALPAWRTIKSGVTDGPDVQQLESSLVSLGYDPDKTVTVDNHFDAKTKAMVERWQDGLGETKTGTVTLGSVVFLPNSTTVTGVTATIGQAVSDGDTIITLAEATKQVLIAVPDGDEAYIKPGLQVGIGDGTGTVTLLRSADSNGTVSVIAVITPDGDVSGSNGSTVKVTVTFDNLQGVLVVPANALLSRLDGSYAVRVQAADGGITWHTVNLLGVSGQKVGISGGSLSAGMNVLVPV